MGRLYALGALFAGGGAVAQGARLIATSTRIPLFLDHLPEVAQGKPDAERYDERYDDLLPPHTLNLEEREDMVGGKGYNPCQEGVVEDREEGPSPSCLVIDSYNGSQAGEVDQDEEHQCHS